MKWLTADRGRERGGMERQQFLVRGMEGELDAERKKEIQGEADRKEP